MKKFDFSGILAGIEQGIGMFVVYGVPALIVGFIAGFTKVGIGVSLALAYFGFMYGLVDHYSNPWNYIKPKDSKKRFERKLPL